MFSVVVVFSAISFLFMLTCVNFDAIKIHTAAIVLGFLPAITSDLQIKVEISIALLHFEEVAFYCNMIQLIQLHSEIFDYLCYQ